MQDQVHLIEAFLEDKPTVVLSLYTAEYGARNAGYFAAVRSEEGYEVEPDRITSADELYLRNRYASTGLAFAVNDDSVDENTYLQAVLAYSAQVEAALALVEQRATLRAELDGYLDAQDYCAAMYKLAEISRLEK
jgi:hypothetical protein